jgi:hypothetical protein
MLRTEGTEYHTVISFCSMNFLTSIGNTDVSGGTMTIVAPAPAAAKMSKIVRSKWSGAWFERRSSGVRAKRSIPHSTKVRAFR